MKYAIGAMLVVGGIVGTTLIASADGRGAGMILFAVLAVAFFASLPVLVARGTRIAGGGSSANRPSKGSSVAGEQQVVDLSPRDQRSIPGS